MATIETLERIKSNMVKEGVSGAHHRAINSLIDSPPPELFKITDDQLDHVLARGIQFEEEQDKGILSVREGLGIALKPFDVPATIASELPRRIVESVAAGKGVMKGIKETGEAFVGRRRYKTPPWQRMMIDVIGFPFPAGGLVGAGMRFGRARKLKGVKVPPRPSYQGFATYGTERGFDIPVGAARGGARRGAVYGARGRAYTPPITGARVGKRRFYQDPTIPMKHPVFFGTGTSPIEQFERSGGGLIDEMMKGRVRSINDFNRQMFKEGYGTAMNEMGAMQAETAMRYTRPGEGARELVKGARGMKKVKGKIKGKVKAMRATKRNK